MCTYVSVYTYVCVYGGVVAGGGGFVKLRKMDETRKYGSMVTSSPVLKQVEMLVECVWEEDYLPVHSQNDKVVTTFVKIMTDYNELTIVVN